MAFRTNKVPAIEERTVSGSSVSFHSNFALPLKACKVSFSATESGSGTKSPSNPYTISGVSGLNLSANSVSVSVNFGDTYYGGELDQIRKKAIIEYGLKTYKGNELWSETSTAYYHSISDMKVGTRMMDGIANWLKTLPSIGMGIMFGSNNRAIYIGKEVNSEIGVSDITGFKNYISNHNLDVVYPLNTPIEIDLSSIPDLSTILGTNTFSTDAGTLEITFADLQEKSASGAVASFNTALAMPLASCKIAVNAWQEGSGDPSPSNVRPIHGFSEVNTYQRAVNLWDEEWEHGYITASGNNSTDANSIRSKNFCPCLPSTSYCFISPKTSYVHFYDSNNAWIERKVASANVATVITSSNNAYYFRISSYGYGTTYNNNISINYPSTDTTYHAYTGNIYTIQLGQEVYGAEVDAVNGVARVEWIKKVIDENSGVIRADNGILYLDDFFDISVDGMSVKCNCYTRGINRSNVSQVMELNNNYSFCCKSGGATDKRVMIKDTRFNTIEEFNEWVALNPISVLIMLAEPFDIQLTPTQIETLIGDNNIFADTGDIDLTYNDLDLAKRGSFREVFKLP